MGNAMGPEPPTKDLRGPGFYAVKLETTLGQLMTLANVFTHYTEEAPDGEVKVCLIGRTPFYLTNDPIFKGAVWRRLAESIAEWDWEVK